VARVLLVGRGSPDRGGIAAYLETLLQSDVAESHALTFLNLSRSVVPIGGRLSANNLVRTAVDIGRVLREAPRHDVVHIHSALAPAVTLARAAGLASAAKLRGRPVLIHAHGGLVASWLTTWQRRVAARLLLAPVDLIVPVAASVASVMQDVAPGRVETVRNGVDLDEFVAHDRPPRSVPRILFAGIVTRRKGLLDLADASRRLHERSVRHEVVIVGGTPDEGAAEETLVRAGFASLAPEVTVTGPRSREEMPGLYRDADIFCLPSWWEAMPLTVLEAMASGLPVVATDVGDVSEIVLDGVTGLVVPPRDASALASALERVVSDTELRRAMGAAGRRRVAEHFGLGGALGAIDAIYRRLGAKP
jgi:glycosyltransferase involved in cell wall biosynthesis